MSKLPKIPKEQRNFAGDGKTVDGEKIDHRDAVTNLQSGQPGDADANLKEQGRFGNIAQNTTHQGNVQDR
jgi:hypothetical protein